MFIGSSCEMGAQDAALRSSELQIWVLTGPLISHTLIMMAVYKNEITFQ